MGSRIDELPARAGTLVLRTVTSLFLLICTLASLASIGDPQVAGGWKVWLPCALLGALLSAYSLRAFRNPVIKISDEYLYWAVLGTYRRFPLASIHRAVARTNYTRTTPMLHLWSTDGRLLRMVPVPDLTVEDIACLHAAFERRRIPITFPPQKGFF